MPNHARPCSWRGAGIAWQGAISAVNPACTISVARMGRKAASCASTLHQVSRLFLLCAAKAGNLKNSIIWDASSKQLRFRLRQSLENGRKLELKYKVCGDRGRGNKDPCNSTCLSDKEKEERFRNPREQGRGKVIGRGASRVVGEGT